MCERRVNDVLTMCERFQVHRVITMLDLDKHCDRKCGTYSGGNKRKLSTAIALVGSPKVIPFFFFISQGCVTFGGYDDWYTMVYVVLFLVLHSAPCGVVVYVT